MSLFDTLAQNLLGREHSKPLLVALDGIDGVGKTTCAQHLGARIQALGGKAIRVTIDDFHQPRARRYRQGRDSPHGYYQDSFDYPRFKEKVLDPLQDGHNGCIQRRGFDLSTDQAVVVEPERVPKSTIVLVDGIFLQRPELKVYWDVVIFLTGDAEVVLQRAVNRDAQGDLAQIESIIQRYKKRYQGGQALYYAEANPEKNADFLIDNTDFEHPKRLKGCLF